MSIDRQIKSISPNEVTMSILKEAIQAAPIRPLQNLNYVKEETKEGVRGGPRSSAAHLCKFGIALLQN